MQGVLAFSGGMDCKHANKIFFCMMNKLILTSALLPGLAMADSVHYGHNHRELVIKFDEPVVPLSVTQNAHNPAASEGDKGLNLFDITGDSDFTPEAQWVDQDRLVLRYKKGFNGSTIYRLAFRPGSDKYLSGKQMPQASFEFSYRPERVSTLEVNAGLPRAAACVYVEEPLTRAQIEFSEKSPVTYVFREVVNDDLPVHDSKRYGRSVRGVPAVAQVRHVPADRVFRALFGEREPWKVKAEEWAGFTLDSPLPGYVLVQAEEELGGEREWELQVDPGEGTDLVGSKYSVNLPAQPAIYLRSTADGEKAGRVLHVFLSAPILKSELVPFFRALEFRLGESAAVSSEDGRSKTISLSDGKSLTFTLQPPAVEEFSEVRATPPSHSPGERENRKFYSYNPPYTAALSVQVTGDVEVPQVLDVVMKAGSRFMLGAESREDLTARLSITPEHPELRLNGSTLLPLKGEHKLHVPTDGLRALHVSAAHLTVEQYLNYAEMLQKQDFSEVENLGDALYVLALKRVRRMVNKELANNEEVRYAERRVKSLRREVPIVGALRARMKDVCFGAEQEICLPSGDAQDRGTAVIDLDSLVGGEAAPGLYILAVRRTPSEDVMAQLRKVRADEKAFDCEMWYLVQVTDLNLSAGQQAVVVTRLSDGSPVMAGRLLQADAEPVELQNGLVPVAVQSERRRGQGRVLVVQSGDDYNALYWNDRHVRMDRDHRLELLSDRSVYRPGEVVHLRGILRSVSPQGEASFDGTKTVSLSISRPDGTVLIDKQLTVNSYGAFDFDFELPGEGEDVIGSYRILVHSGKYRAYHHVQCQQFRRDSFECSTQLTLVPVRPDHFTCKVSATDLNGTPLSGAKVRLQVETSFTQRTDGAPSHVEKEQLLTLGADGTAEFIDKLPGLDPFSVHNSVSVRGEVVNDREEVRALPWNSEAFFPADFRAELADGERLYLYPVTEKGGEPRVLARDQQVHLRLLSELPRTRELPNGVLIRDFVRLTIWETELTVPADSVNGIVTGVSERWQAFLANLPQEELQHGRLAPPRIVEITGKDPAGNSMGTRFSNYRPMPVVPGRRSALLQTTISPEGDNLRATLISPHAGRAVVVLRSVLGSRALPPVEVKEGVNEYTLPLAPGEKGLVYVSFLLPEEVDGLYRRLSASSAGTEVVDKSACLAVELQLPQNSVRPGEKLSIGGRVLSSDGKPVAAQVTLFAVDEGMLSVRPGRVPNLLSEFTRVWVGAFEAQPRHFTLATEGAAAPVRELLEGIWSGQCLSADGKILPAKPIRMRTYHSPVAVQGARKMKRANGPAEFGMADTTAMVDRDAAVEEYAEPMACEAPSVAMPAPSPSVAAGGTDGAGDGAGALPRLRTNFVPVAVWSPALEVDGDGNFRTEVTLPDTLTTYKVFALALGADGRTFGNAEGKFTVNQPVMLTPGTPLFMSLGDHLRLPLTITNATEAEETWTVTLEDADCPQKVTLQPGATTTLYFDYKATEEGERKLQWQAVAATGGDAVEGCFGVRFPAPLLREAHHLVLEGGEEPLKLAALLAPELATSTRGQMEILLSANPLLHLDGCMELVNNSPYPCSHYSATAMMVWMLYDRLAPFSPIMAQTEPREARSYVTRSIRELLKCQQEDGGMSFWFGARESSPWTSAYVGLLLTLAQQQGFDVPADCMQRLQSYLRLQLERSRSKKPEVAFSPFDLYAIGRTLDDRATITSALSAALNSAEKGSEQAAIFGSHCWWRTSYAVASLRFLAEMDRDSSARHSHFIKWMRAVGHDYRHASTWDGGWMLIALHEYLRLTPPARAQATLSLQDGQQLTLGNGVTTITPPATATLGEVPTVLTPTSGTVYLTMKARALPEQTEYPGVTEKGLQITRIYEKRGEDGVWREVRDFNVGDVVRVTLTCAKSDRDLEYFVLEDYLPSCMEAINPNIPSQAAGLEWTPWSHWFDHKEYMSHRVRGFCTRWCGRDLLNMTYYARVKRAGTSIAPPAQGQLMYEPQTYGLSPNAVIISK